MDNDFQIVIDELTSKGVFERGVVRSSIFYKIKGTHYHVFHDFLGFIWQKPALDGRGWKEVPFEEVFNSMPLDVAEQFIYYLDVFTDYDYFTGREWI